MIRAGESLILPPPPRDNGESLGGIPRVSEEHRTVSIGQDLAILYNYYDPNAVDVTHMLGDNVNSSNVYDEIMQTIGLTGDVNTLNAFADLSLQKTTEETKKDNNNTLVWVGGIIVLVITALIFFKWRKAKKRLRRK